MPGQIFDVLVAFFDENVLRNQGALSAPAVHHNLAGFVALYFAEPVLRRIFIARADIDKDRRFGFLQELGQARRG